jgi:hypothetical protein
MFRQFMHCIDCDMIAKGVPKIFPEKKLANIDGDIIEYPKQSKTHNIPSKNPSQHPQHYDSATFLLKIPANIDGDMIEDPILEGTELDALDFERSYPSPAVLDDWEWIRERMEVRKKRVRLGTVFLYCQIGE